MFYVGVDISKHSFSVCIIDSNAMQVVKEDSFPYSYDGLSLFANLLSSYKSPIIVMESSGRFHIPLFVFLSKKGFNVRIINPKTVHNFVRFYSSTNPSKTDRRDAFFIALLAASNPSLVEKASVDLSSIRFLAREVERIKHEIAECKTQIKYILSVLFPEAENHFNIFSNAFLSIIRSFPSAPLIAEAGKKAVRNCFIKTKGRKPSFSPDDVVNLASKSIGISNKGLEISLQFYVDRLFFLLSYANKIASALQSEVEKFFLNEINIISSIPGISPLLAARFIAEVGDISRFETWKQLVKYAGTDPVIKQSGSMKVEKGISKQGNPHLRNTLYQMATGVVKWCPVFKNYFRRKFSQFGKYKKAMIAVVNKLIRVLFAMLSKGQCFQHPLPSSELVS